MAVSIKSSTKSLREGNKVVFYATGIENADLTSGKLSYTLSGTGITTGDFSGVSSLTGLATVTDGVAIIPLTVLADQTTETTETLTLTAASATATTTINDSSFTPANTITSISEYANEGSTVTFNLDVKDGKYNYAYSGTGIATADLSGVTSLTTNTITVTGGRATIPVKLANDQALEGQETLTLTLTGTASTATAGISVSDSVKILDTSIAPTFTVVPSVSLAEEGKQVLFNITDGKAGTYSFALTGTGSKAADLSVAKQGVITAVTVASGGAVDAVTGSVTIPASGTASIPVSILADAATEGNEILTLTLTGTGVPASSTASVVIKDTSVARTNVITPSATSVKEGASVTFNITNAVDGDYTYAISNAASSTFSSTDLKVGTYDSADKTYEGTLKVQKGVASLSVSALADATTEGSEKLIFTLSGKASTATAGLTSKSSVLIDDTSLTPTYDLLPSTESGSEGGNVTFNVSNAAKGSYTYEVTSSGTVTSDDLTVGPLNALATYASGKFTGNISISDDGKAIIPMSVLNDHTTEGTEVFILNLKNSSGTSVAESSYLVKDTSVSYSYTITPDAKTIGEGKTVKFTVSNAPADEEIAYILSGTGVTTADFTDSSFTDSSASLTGTAIVGKGGQVAIPVYIRADSSAESTEIVTIQLFKDADGDSTVDAGEAITVVGTNTVSVVAQA